MDHERAREDARLFAAQIGAIEVALAGGRLAVSTDRVALPVGGERFDQRMLGRDHHAGHAVQRVGPRGVDPQHIAAGLAGQAVGGTGPLPAHKGFARRTCRRDEEIDLGTGAPADPVALQFLDACRPVEPLELVLQPVGIRGDPQHPLPQRDANHGMAAPFAHPADHLLVGQHRAERGAPVDRRLRLVGQPVRVAVFRYGIRAGGGHGFGNGQIGDRPALLGGGIEPGVEEHEEDPLRPAHISRIGRRQFAAPVVTEPEHLELAAEGVDVALGTLARRGAGADRVFLGRQAEGIEAHRMHDARAPHPLEPREDVGGRVALGMPHVQAVAAGVGKHVQHVRLSRARQPRRGECVVRVPPGLPLRFDPRGLIAWHRVVQGCRRHRSVEGLGLAPNCSV